MLPSLIEVIFGGEDARADFELTLPPTSSSDVREDFALTLTSSSEGWEDFALVLGGGPVGGGGLLLL